MERPTPRFYTLAWSFYMLIALAGIVWIGWRGDLGWGTFVNTRTWWRDLAAGVTAGALLVGLWALAARMLASARKVEEHIAGLLGAVERDEIIALALISGIAEEIFFRGGVQGSWGWLWATALFAALHSGPGRAFRAWTLFALIAGLLFAGLTLWTGNLLAAIAAHASVNGVNLHRLAKRQQSAPAG